MPKDQDAVVCTFHDGPPAVLSFTFHKEMHPDNYNEIAAAMIRAGADKINELNAVGIEREGNHGNLSGRA